MILSGATSLNQHWSGSPGGLQRHLFAGNQAVNSSTDCGFGVQPLCRLDLWWNLFLEEAKLDARFAWAKMTPFVKCVEHIGASQGRFGGALEKVEGSFLVNV